MRRQPVLKKLDAGRVIEDVKKPREAATVEVLGLLYQRRYQAFLRVAEAIVGDPERARDVVQDAFARAIRSRFDYRGEGSLEAWVWRTLVNTARSARHDRSLAHLPLDELVSAAPRPDGQAADGHVRTLIAALPERQRLVLFLRYYADLDYRAIAEALAIEPGTVGATLNHAHATIRGALEGVPQ